MAVTTEYHTNGVGLLSEVVSKLSDSANTLSSIRLTEKEITYIYRHLNVIVEVLDKASCNEDHKKFPTGRTPNEVPF